MIELRLADIIQMLRTASQPVTAATLPETLEVTTRTGYRDVATLLPRRVPIEGPQGLRYMLHVGFDLPPLMFNPNEIEMIIAGAEMLRRTGDEGLQTAAERLLWKIMLVLPEAMRPHLADPPFFISGYGASPRNERKLCLAYRDQKGNETRRKIWPFAIACGANATLIGAWCDLRAEFRDFRADRVQTDDRLYRVSEKRHRLGPPVRLACEKARDYCAGDVFSGAS